MPCLRKPLESFALFALRARGFHLSFKDLKIIGLGIHVLDCAGSLISNFFRHRGDL